MTNLGLTMKRKKVSISKDWLIIACAILSGCEDNGALDETYQAPAPVIRINAQIEQNYTTRVNDSGFGDGDQIGVFVVNYQNGEPQPLQLSGNHADNVMFTYSESDNKWTGSYQLYWKDAITPVDAYGYYPFNASLPSVTAYAFEVQANQRDMNKESGMTGYESSDFLWAKTGNITPTAGVLTLNHTHLMSGVKVVLVEGEGFENGEWNNSEKSVLIENVHLHSTIDLCTGTVSSTQDGEASNIIPQESKGEYRAIVVPQTVSEGTNLLAVTIDGQAAHFAKPEAMTFLAGKIHRFTLVVNKGLEKGDFELELLDEAILPWENDPLSHNGAAREYITVHVEEGEYIGDVINRMGLNPSEIINLKLTGTLSSDHDHFAYIRENMPQLEAVHMKELRTKDQQSFYWEGNGTAGDGWGVPPYEQPIRSDDYIPRNAFENMNYLAYVVWPDHLKGIGDLAFAGTGLRGSLIFPEGLKHIGGSAFEAYEHQISSITGEVYIPSTVEYIGDNAFCPFDNKQNFMSGELVLPHKMKYLGNNAFAGSPSITGTIRIPEGLTVVNKAFAPNMTGDVIIPQGVKVVNGTGGNPSSVYFPEGVTEIGNGAFWNTSGLKGDIRLPSTLKKIGETAFAGTNISHIHLPEGLEIISNRVFYGCGYLQDTITIPSTVKQIGEGAFDGCVMLTAVILPEGLEEIKSDAFANCRSLDHIRCLGTTPPVLNASAFNGVEKNNFTVVVPEEAVETYRNAEGWKEFKRIAAYRNFVCRPMQAKLLNKPNTRSIILNADDNWTVTHCPEWAKITPTSGYKKTELTVEIAELAGGAGDRQDSIVFTLGGKTNEEGEAITTYYKITQFDSEYGEDSQLTLQTATQGKGIPIVFTADGYDAEDIANGSFITDIKEGMKYFFAIEPYKTYQNYFNVYADVAMSYESGVCSNVNIWRETKFNTIYGAGTNGRLSIEPETVMSYVLNNVEETAINANNIDQSLIICILNSDAYEGVTSMYSSGAAVAFVPHSRYDYPNDYRGLIQHEAGGHGFGKLGDEYVYHNSYIQKCTCPCCAHVDHVAESKSMGWYRNLSLSGKYSDIEWRHLIFNSRYDDIVDIYEGGYMHRRGIYRSEVNSCMNNNVPYYSTVSRQAIVERIKEYAGETFDFEEFVNKDSRKMGDKFIVRSHGSESAPSFHNQPPIIKKGSPMDYIKKHK